jgi:tetratricopeptide (TPR) repeat protein
MHYLKRFKAAAKTAKMIKQTCESAFDEQSQFELEAYCDYIQAICLMEYRKYEEAIDHLLRAQIIYKQLSEYRDPMEALIYTEKVGQLQTFIRSCSANLLIPVTQTVQHQDAENIIRSIKKSYSVTNQDSSMDGQITEIKYAGKTIPLKSEKLRLAFAKIKD